jgi:hypothetical protein
VEACKGRRSSGCREPLSEVELTRCQTKRIYALVNLKKSRFTLDFIEQYEFLKNSPRAWARRTELVFCAYFGLKYDIIVLLDLSKKGRQLG